MTVESFLTEGPLTVAEIIDAIRTQTSDEEAHYSFSDAKIKLALRQAILNSKGKFFYTDTYDLAFEGGNFGPYDLPAAVDRVIQVRRPRTGYFESADSLNGIAPDQLIHSWRHVKNWTSNTISFDRDYYDATLTILYESDVRVPIEKRAVSGEHTAATTTLTLSDDNPRLWQMALPCFARWEDEVIKITAISGNTSATIARGQLSTTAATHADGTDIEPLVMGDTPHLYNFLFSEIGRLLNQWRIQEGNRNTNVAPNITAARMFKEDAQDALSKIRNPRKTSYMTFKRTRRPRRRY